MNLHHERIDPGLEGEAGDHLGRGPVCQRPAFAQPGEGPLSPVELFAPWAGAEERLLRDRIHRARDIAQARATRVKHDRASSLYWIATDLASDWVFCRAPIEVLNDVLAGLGRLFLVAGMIERLEVRDD